MKSTYYKINQSTSGV